MTPSLGPATRALRGASGCCGATPWKLTEVRDTLDLLRSLAPTASPVLLVLLNPPSDAHGPDPRPSGPRSTWSLPFPFVSSLPQNPDGPRSRERCRRCPDTAIPKGAAGPPSRPDAGAQVSGEEAARPVGVARRGRALGVTAVRRPTARWGVSCVPSRVADVQAPHPGPRPGLPFPHPGVPATLP